MFLLFYIYYGTGVVLEVGLTTVCEDCQTNEETQSFLCLFFFISVAYTAIFSVVHNTDVYIVYSQNTDNSINYRINASLIQNQQNNRGPIA